uniref:EGF-like domain-containing protein n=1 Tax=Syphacia muris TaxID=451379 RepID=A0A158R446_9BILA
MYQQNQLQRSMYSSQQNSITSLQQQSAQRLGFANVPYQMENTTDGASVTFQFNSYTNDGFKVSNTTTCVCPLASCPFIKDSEPACQLSFIALFSAKGQSVKYIASEFIPISNINKQLQSDSWKTSQTFRMASAPIAVDIIIQYYGLEISSDTGNIVAYNKIGVVQTYGVFPQSPSQQHTIQKTNPPSSISFTLSWQCLNGKLGDKCDMNCNLNGSHALCTSDDGVSSYCTYSGSRLTQCTVCQNGFNQNGTGCLRRDQLIIQRSGVSSGYRSWTIVLGVLLGLAVLLLIALVIIFWIKRRKSEDSTEADTTTPRQYNYNHQTTTRPLLKNQDEWNEPIRPASINPLGRNGLSDNDVSDGNNIHFA